jgi:hypothetical protein
LPKAGRQVNARGMAKDSGRHIYPVAILSVFC